MGQGPPELRLAVEFLLGWVWVVPVGIVDGAGSGTRIPEIDLVAAVDFVALQHGQVGESNIGTNLHIRFSIEELEFDYLKVLYIVGFNAVDVGQLIAFRVDCVVVGVALQHETPGWFMFNRHPLSQHGALWVEPPLHFLFEDFKVLVV